MKKLTASLLSACMLLAGASAMAGMKKDSMGKDEMKK